MPALPELWARLRHHVQDSSLLSPSGTVPRGISRMSADNADKDSSQKGWSERISELGPAWITAIVGLIAVLGGGGYVAGHVSGTHDPAPQPTVTVTATVTAAATVTAQAARVPVVPHSRAV